MPDEGANATRNSWFVPPTLPEIKTDDTLPGIIFDDRQDKLSKITVYGHFNGTHQNAGSQTEKTVRHGQYKLCQWHPE